LKKQPVAWCSISDHNLQPQTLQTSFVTSSIRIMSTSSSSSTDAPAQVVDKLILSLKEDAGLVRRLIAKAPIEELKMLHEQIPQIIFLKQEIEYAEKVMKEMETKMEKTSIQQTSSSSSSDDFVVIAGGADSPSAPVSASTVMPATPVPSTAPNADASSSSQVPTPAPELRKGRAFIFLALDDIPLVWDTKHVEALLKVVKDHASISGTIDTSEESMTISTIINLDKLVVGNEVSGLLFLNSSSICARDTDALSPMLGRQMLAAAPMPRVPFQTHGDLVILLHGGLFNESVKGALRQITKSGVLVKHLYIRDPDYNSLPNNLENETAELIGAANIQAEVLKEVLAMSAAQHEKALAASITATEEQARLSLESRVTVMKTNSTAEIDRSAKRLTAQWTSALESALIGTIPPAL